MRHAVRMWMAGLGLGLRLIPKDPVLGMKRTFLPVGYWRTQEFAYAWRRLGGLGDESVILDMGSPKEFGLHVARVRGSRVVTIDILPEEIDLVRRYATALSMTGTGPGCLAAEVQDGRRLTFPDDTFHAAFSLSVLEHIPDDGDSLAVRELMRVVKPGGLIVITVPYSVGYQETWVPRSVYDRERVGEESVFFERHYDEAALRERLIRSAAGELVDLEIWGEGRVRMERILEWMRHGRDLLSPLEPLLSLLSLRRVDRAQGHPMAAFLTLRKPLLPPTGSRPASSGS